MSLIRDQYGWLRAWVVAALFALSVAAVVVLIAFGLNALQKMECRRVGEVMERESRYGFVEGCFLKTPDGKWIPADAFRSTDAEES